MIPIQENLDQPITGFMHNDYVTVRPDWTVRQALDSLVGQHGTGGIFYVYVTDAENRLLGVLPIRRLLSTDPPTIVSDIMISRVVSLNDQATVFDACDLFLIHKFLAIPVVDENRRLVGQADVNLFTDELQDFAEKQQAADVFNWIGVRMAQLNSAGIFKSFCYRFPWLTATLAGGIACAVLAGFFEATLTETAILAAFLTVCLGLGESISVQSMTVTIQNLHGVTHHGKFLGKRLLREIPTAVLLALSCGAVILLVSGVWKHEWLLSVAIGRSIFLTMLWSSLVGVMIPSILHRFDRDPKIAAGPLTLAISDLSTLFLYLNAATIALKIR